MELSIREEKYKNENEDREENGTTVAEDRKGKIKVYGPLSSYYNFGVL